MSLTKRGQIRKKRHKKILKITKGFYGSQSKLYRTANQRALKSMVYAYSDRKKKKRNFKSIWIRRINGSAKLENSSYNKIVNILKNQKIILNKKILSEIIIKDKETLKKIILHEK